MISNRLFRYDHNTKPRINILILGFLLFTSSLFSSGFYTNAAALYLKAQENGLPIGIAGDKVLTPDFVYGWGFRLGFGYELPKDDWNIQLKYMHIHNNAWSEEEGIIFPSWGSGVAESEKTHWRLHLGIIDLELLRYCLTTSSLYLEPHFGVRTAWIRQKFNIHYNGEETVFSTKNKFWGMGLTGGVNGEWMLGQGFSLFFQTAYSLLAGEFYLHEHTVDLYRVRSIFDQTASIVDLILGPRWGIGHFSVCWSWENHFYFSQNQLFHLTSQNTFFSNQGDLFLQGWSLNFSYCF